MKKFERYFLLLLILYLFLQSYACVNIPLKLINTTYSKNNIIKKIELEPGIELPIKSKNSQKKFNKLTQKLCGSIKSLDNLLLVLEIKLGSDNQPFNVILDTASFILWIPEKNSTDILQINHHYDPTTSITSNKTPSEFNIKYGSGYAEGYLYYDRVKLEPFNSILMMFGSANKTNFDVSGADGIMGLARKYNQNLLSSILTLKETGLIKTGIFSIKYYEKTKSADLFIGEEHSDFDYSENIGSCPLLSKSYYDNYFWTCQLYTISLIHNSINTTVDTNISVLFDTGTNAIVLPKYILSFLTPHLSNYDCFRYDLKHSTSYIACSNISRLPNFVVEVGQYYLFLPKSLMFSEYQMQDNSIIYLMNIHFENHVDPAIIGQPFFYQFHTMFNINKNILKFYNKDKRKIVKSQRNTNKETKEEKVYGLLKFVVILLLLLMIFLVGILLWCIFKTKNFYAKKQFSRENELTYSLGINQGFF